MLIQSQIPKIVRKKTKIAKIRDTLVPLLFFRRRLLENPADSGVEREGFDARGLDTATGEGLPHDFKS